MEQNEQIGGRRRFAALNAADSAVLRAFERGGGSVFTWEQALRVLLNNLTLAIGCAIFLTLLAVAGAFMLKDVYEPAARLEVDPPASGIKTLQEIDSGQSDSLDYLETQARILQSDALAIRVIRALRLDQNLEFVSKKDLAKYAGASTSSLQSIQTSPTENAFLQSQLDLANQTPLESIALDTFRKRLSVSTGRNSRLIDVSFRSHDPKLAQLVTNTLVTQFMDQNYQNRYTSTMETSDWLSSQLNDLREKVEESNQAVADYQRKYGFIDADDKDVPMAQYMAEINHQLSDAQATRIEEESYVRMIDLGQAESIPAVREDKVYQDLSTRYADSRAQLAQSRAIYGDENSNVKKLESEVQELAAQMEAEKARIIKQVRTSYEAANSREQLMLNERDNTRSQLGDASSHLVEYRVLENEALATAELYNTLQARLREAGIYAGLRSSNMHIVDLASTLRKPSGPHRAAIIGIGVVLSCVLALALVFAKEGLDNTIRTPEDIQAWTGLPSLAMLPPVSSANRGRANDLTQRHSLLEDANPQNGNVAAPGILLDASDSAEGEAVRGLRTTLAYARPDAPPRVVLVTSACAGEGKTTIAINLAAAYAQRGKTVLLDCDLRQPAVASILRLTPSITLADVLMKGASPLSALCQVGQVPDLLVLAGQRTHKSPVDLIAADGIRETVTILRNEFDHIVVDSPPAIPYSDARILSSLADSVIVVARYGLTTRRALARCTELLDEMGAPLRGVVLNGISALSPDYRYYNYGFSRSINGHNYYAPDGTAKPSSSMPRPPEPGAKSRSAHA